jgi:hypothetical protein
MSTGRVTVRRRVEALTVALLVGAAFALVAWPGTPPVADFTAESFHRIRVGMSRAEVGAVLGPTGNYRTGAVDDAEGWENLGDPFGSTGPRSAYQLCWKGNSGEIRIYFSRSDEVTEAYFQPQAPSASLWKRVRWHYWRWFPSAAPVGAD